MPVKAKSKTKKRAPAKNPGTGKGGSITQTHYRPEYAKMARALVLQFGALDCEVAEFLEKTPKTIMRWKTKYPEFAEALIIPLDSANKRVDLSLFKEATGYWVTEEEKRHIDGKVVLVQKKIWNRAQPTAIIWWGKIKQGYGGFQDVPSLPPPDDGAITIDNATGKQETDRQIARRIQFMLNKGRNEEMEMDYG